ncbi:MAG TPA: hypothetical protein VGN11_07910 [Candidatus Baltobacteraceae bacterium]|nr:hypothetical protein [Candidatus Baltobacteraceae bacterium]
MKKYFIAALAAGMIFGSALPVLAQQQPDTGMQPAPGAQSSAPATDTDNDPNADMNDPAAMGPSGQYGDPICGVWQNGTWVGNTRCPGYHYGPHRVRVAGTITAVKGHLVTVQMSEKSVVINDQPALDRQTTGKVAVGRQIIAYGYWNGGTFYATSLE